MLFIFCILTVHFVSLLHQCVAITIWKYLLQIFFCIYLSMFQKAELEVMLAHSFHSYTLFMKCLYNDRLFILWYLWHILIWKSVWNCSRNSTNCSSYHGNLLLNIDGKQDLQYNFFKKGIFPYFLAYFKVHQSSIIIYIFWLHIGIGVF